VQPRSPDRAIESLVQRRTSIVPPFTPTKGPIITYGTRLWEEDAVALLADEGEHRL
jgi:hypothetical protein